MLSPLLVYQILILAVLLVLLGMVIVNMLVLPNLSDYELMGREPEVAILVPARNEQDNIEACLLGLLAQGYSNCTIWLYDDASTDATGEIAARLAAQHPERLHVIEGSGDPPPGWLGKANACYRLYGAMKEQANPAYVLFTDADVRHEPDMLRRAVATAQAKGSGLLSVFPRQVIVSWAERLAVPLMQCWAVYGILPLPAAFSQQTGPAFAAANGQFMLFTAEAYEACGGHAAVRGNVLEDVGLARAVKRAGYRALLADGGPLIKTRMYTGSREVWQGYSKNVFAFFGYSPVFLALGVVALAALYVLPPLIAIFGLLNGRLEEAWFYLPLAQYLVAVGTRLLLSARFKYPLLDTLLNPVAIAYLIAVGLNSVRWARTRKGAWKGRPHIAARR